jgi:hypothetical protein
VKRGDSEAAPMQEDWAADTRLRALRQGACDAGRQWAERFCADLRTEGRAVQGGWPGTMAEARAVVRASLQGEISARRRSAVTTVELEWLTRIAYASARQDWLSRAERETPEPA